MYRIRGLAIAQMDSLLPTPYVTAKRANVTFTNLLESEAI